MVTVRWTRGCPPLFATVPTKPCCLTPLLPAWPWRHLSLQSLLTEAELREGGGVTGWVLGGSVYTTSRPLPQTPLLDANSLELVPLRKEDGSEIKR